VLAAAAKRGVARLDPEAGAALLVSMLSHVAAHRSGLAESGIDAGRLEANLGRVLRWAAGLDPEA
jgi:hypothetical protein